MKRKNMPWYELSSIGNITSLRSNSLSIVTISHYNLFNLRKRIDLMHATWVETIQKFFYLFKHNVGSMNKVDDA